MTIAIAPPSDLTRHEPWPWRCRWCRRVLGVVAADTVSIKHSGRQIEARLPCSQVCDHCGTLNTLDTERGKERA